MALLITGTVCGLFSFTVALILQLRLPGWTFFAGFSGMRSEKRANIDAPRLVRTLSVLFYILAAGFLGGSILYSVKAVNESVLIPAFFVISLAVFDLVWAFYRKFDRNTYPAEALRAGRYFVLMINLAFFVLCLVFIR